MTKQVALGDSFYVGPYDLSGDIGALSAMSSTRAVIDVSALPQTGPDRLLGRADGSIEFNAFYDTAAGQSHAVLSTVGTATASTVASYFNGSDFGNPAASVSAKLVSYDKTVGADQSISVTSSAQSADGHPVEWGQMLTTAKQTFASAGTSVALDAGAGSSFGAAAYLHAFSIGSGTATVAVQHSTSGTASWSNVTGLVFTDVTAATFERINTTPTRTLNRYRRLNVTGTFTDLVLAVNLSAYKTSQT